MRLLIPGPVTTRPETRAAMAQDFAPWDNDFRDRVIALRGRVLAIAHGEAATHTVLPLQGCGHFATEAAIRSFVPPGGRMLVRAADTVLHDMGIRNRAPAFVLNTQHAA